jgi:hypothetical protein
MAFDAHKNFALSLVAVAPTPATSGTSLTVTAGEGAGFPAVPFNATIAPPSGVPTRANAEIVRVTARSGDVLTITRAQEGSTARSIQIGDLIAATITAKSLTDIEAPTDLVVSNSVAVGAGSPAQNGAMRLENSSVGAWRGVVSARNQANTTDIVMLYLDINNGVTLGGAPGGMVTVTPSGSINSSTQPRAGASRAAVQAFPNATWTNLTFDTELFDVGNCFSLASPTALSVPLGGAGLYLVVGMATFAGNATGARYLQIVKNDVGQLMMSAAAFADICTIPILLPMVLNPGDALQLQGYQSSGGSLNVQGNFFMLKLW